MHPDESAPALFAAPDTPRYGESELEKSVRESIAAIIAGVGIKPSKMFLAQTAIELARSIAKGNAKGRAVANESAQLVATLELLDPTTDAGDDPDALPEDLKRLVDAFAQRPAVPSLDGAALPRLGAA